VKIEFNFESPYNADGSPRTDLPTGEVLAWDGKYWIAGVLREVNGKHVDCIELDSNGNEALTLFHIKRFAPLPTIIEQDDLL